MYSVSICKPLSYRRVLENLTAGVIPGEYVLSFECNIALLGRKSRRLTVRLETIVIALHVILNRTRAVAMPVGRNPRRVFLFSSSSLSLSRSSQESYIRQIISPLIFSSFFLFSICFINYLANIEYQFVNNIND